MDLYGYDRKLSEMGDGDFIDFLDSDGFPPFKPANDYGFEPMDTGDWFDHFLAEDPILNDRMMSDALHPPHIKAEHSYSLANSGSETETDADAALKGEQMDKDGNDMIGDSNLPLDLTFSAARENKKDRDRIKEEPIIDVESDSPVVTVTRPTTINVSQQTLLKPQPTIILATQTFPSTLLSNGRQERFVLPKVNIKVEAQDPPSSPEHCSAYESLSLPPTPPSSSTSDSEGSQSPGRSAPSSPIRQTQIRHPLLRTTHNQQSLFSSPIPTSGMLILSEEEKRTLVSEGYPIPNKLPLNKQEEKNLKKIRRKIKNKISAQESRRKKKEYLDTLEKRVEAYNQENGDLRKKLENLETNNRSLLSQLQKLQSIVAKVRPSSATSQTSTCLMVLVLFFAVFLGSWNPTSFRIGYSQTVSAPAVVPFKEPSGPVMGPAVKDAIVDKYSTPNIRSRVLLSLKDELDDLEPYGPHIPYSYNIFSSLFSGVSEDPDNLELSGVPADPVIPHAIIMEGIPEEQTGNETEDDDTLSWPTGFHPDIAANLAADVIQREKNTTA